MSLTQNLVIVESPAKAKTIKNYLGPGYEVASSYGHIRDLPKKDKAVDTANNFEPTYVINADKKKLVKELKQRAAAAKTVYLASDDDREGEAISWHLKEALQLQESNTKRIVFREITKNAIQNAIKNPRDIDIALVNAQQTRRILDRLVGYDLSPLLWQKIKPGLSAGRVQSVAVRMIVERERAIQAFVTTSAFAVTAVYDLGNKAQLKAELPDRLPTEQEASDFLSQCIGATFTVKDLEKKLGERSPAAPFTTSTLQQEASQKLGYSVTRTMTLAQHLYEAGKISYMRTDSVTLSQEAMGAIQQEIEKLYGAAYCQARQYKTKSASAQEAHEAIRPTDVSNKIVSDDPSEQRLYELIWKRTVASQMANAKLEKTTIHIGVSTVPQQFVTYGEMIQFDGFLKVYAAFQQQENEADEEGEEETLLPQLQIGQALTLNHMQARERFSKPPARYSEASLVKQLEEKGIGRPSTYAPTINTIQERGYIIKESREGKERSYRHILLKDATIQKTVLQEIVGSEKQKLFPTDVAMVVNDFLVKHFSEITDYGFTAKVETQLDDIAIGKKVWTKILADFYAAFYPQVVATQEIDPQTLATSRLLGKDPFSGKPITARIGRYGPLVQLGDAEGEEKPKFAKLGKDQSIEHITLEDALELFKLPRTVGDWETAPIVANIGPFGPYLKYENKYYPIPKEEDPITVNLERAIGIIQEKRQKDAANILKTFPEEPSLQILNGRFGPYLKAGKQNIKLPKDTDYHTLDIHACQQLVAKAMASEKDANKEESVTCTSHRYVNPYEAVAALQSGTLQ